MGRYPGCLHNETVQSPGHAFQHLDTGTAHLCTKFRNDATSVAGSSDVIAEPILPHGNAALVRSFTD